MNVIATISLQTPDGHVSPGGILELDDAEAKALIARGFAEPAGKSTATKTPETKVDEADADILAIIDAIAVLDESGFGKDGKPLVKALEDVLDRDIGQEQRDRAWKRYEQGNAS